MRTTNSVAALVIPSVSPSPARVWTLEDRMADARILLSTLIKHVRPEIRDEVFAIAEQLFELTLEKTFGDRSKIERARA